jgi:hypothetical protein
MKDLCGRNVSKTTQLDLLGILFHNFEWSLKQFRARGEYNYYRMDIFALYASFLNLF